MNSSVMFLILIITRKRLTILSVYASRSERRKLKVKLGKNKVMACVSPQKDK